MADLATIHRLEELTLNTAPATHQAFYDGWVLRASGTDTRRANSATALQSSNLPLEQKIAYTEAWYRTYGQSAIFRLTAAFSPADLDATLEARGYTREADTFVMTLDLAGGVSQDEPVLPAGAKLVERTVSEGLDDVHRMRAVTPEHHERDTQRQALWKGPQRFVSLKTINGVASTGMARMEAGHIGIFSMRTAGNARGKGYATLLVAHLLAWGREQGASKAFLQVDQANEAAIAVYQKFGFTPAYSYWHRVQGA